jgi:hypothetical protein
MPQIERSFEVLKNQVRTPSIHIHFDLTKTCIIERNISDFALGAILLQKDDDEMLLPIVFYA